MLDKWILLDQVPAIAAAWRTLGRRIAFTVGSFDLIHPGHVYLLESAKQLADVVIVALHGDADVTALKGAGRPVLDQNERTHVLSAFWPVDHVVILDQPSPLSILQAIRPDVLVLGPDPAADEAAAIECVESYGGRSERIPRLGTYSISKIIERAIQS